MAGSSSSQRLQKATHSPDWSDLPTDVTLAILQKLGPAALLERAQMVCKTWRKISFEEPSLWTSINSSRFKGSDSRKRNMTKRAIDLSCGKLVDAKIDSYQLLHYIADRESQLRRLEIHLCPTKSLMEAVRKLPLLEELRVYGQSLSNEDLRTIGTCCQHLKSLKFAKDYCSYWEVPCTCDEEALAIGRSMPQLRHLEIDGERLTETGLKAILDGCSHLQSLKLLSVGDRNLVQTLAKLYSVEIDYPQPRKRHCPYDRFLLL